MTDPKRIIIAIDGPAGAGKSTVASRIAKRFKLLNLETGAMYRAFALKALEHGISPDDAEALDRLAAATSIRLESSGDGNRVFLDGAEVTSRLRDAPVTEAASRVSVHPAIRTWMVDLQRQLGEVVEAVGVVVIRRPGQGGHEIDLRETRHELGAKERSVQTERVGFVRRCDGCEQLLRG